MKNRPEIRIIGQLQLQNRLLAHFLTVDAGFECIWSANPDPNVMVAPRPYHQPIFLLDCYGLGKRTIGARIELIAGNGETDRLIVLLNAASDYRIPNEIVKKGVRGLFFRDATPDTIQKGIIAVLNGELWLSRSAFYDIVGEPKPGAVKVDPIAELLTSREKEILICVASGVSNQTIATLLDISANKVKTDLNAIYGKIKVPNRLQAAFWAATNL